MACFTRLALGRYLGTLPLKCSPGIRLFGLSGLLDTCFLLGIWKFSTDGRSSCLGDQRESESRSDVSDSLRPHGLYSPWNSPDQNTGVGSLFLLQGDLPNPGIEPRSPTLQADSLLAEPQGQPNNIGEGSLFGLQGIFLTQESSQGLLHCRQILYQLSFQGSPWYMMYSENKLNKQGDNIQPWHTPFSIWNQSVIPCPVLTVASWSAYRFLRRQVRWSGILISKNFPQFVVTHTAKGFSVVSEAEVDVFLLSLEFL